MRKLKAGESYTGEELVELLGGDLNERLYAFGNDRMVVIVVDEGNDNYEVLHIVRSPEKSKDKVFYSLCEDDILEVAAAEGVELTKEEMPQVKKGIESGLGNCWWDIVKSAIGDILTERR